MSVEHTWSHKKSGSIEYTEGKKVYGIEEFRTEKPNQYRKLLEFLEESLGTT